LGLGAEANVTAEVVCATTIQNLTQEFVMLVQELPTLDFEDQVDAIQAFVDQLLQDLKVLRANAQMTPLVLAPIYEAFVQNPAGFLLEVVNNAALNLPQLHQMMQQEFVDIVEGQYLEAGELKAERIQTVFRGVVNF